MRELIYPISPWLLHDSSKSVPYNFGFMQNICRSINHSADNSRDIFFLPSTLMSRAFPATSLSAGYRVPEIRDLRKSDGVEFKVTGRSRRDDQSEPLNDW